MLDGQVLESAGRDDLRRRTTRNQPAWPIATWGVALGGWRSAVMMTVGGGGGFQGGADAGPIGKRVESHPLTEGTSV
jgi:hypothetical protein